MKTEIKQRIEKIKVGQVPEGYKKTKIGIVPKEWEIHKLSEHLTESRILGSNGAAAKKITVKLWNKGVFEKQELHEGSANTTYYKRKSGQFVYSKLDFLNCAFGIIPKHLDGYESTQDLPCFDVDGVDTYYLLTYVTQRNFYTHFGMIADGGRKARRVGTKDMMSFPLAYPPLAEQKKIAKILSAQDKLIELQQKKIEELQKLKKVYLNKMFPKKGENVPEWRFKGFTDAWEQRKFSDVVATRRGLTYKPSDIRKNGVRVLRSSNIAEDSFTLSDEDVFVVREAVNIDCARANDILITAANGSSRLVGKHTVISGIPEESAVHGGFMLLGTTKEPHFVNASMGSSWYRRFIELFVAGGNGAIGNLNKNDLDNQEIAIPSEEEQKKIGSFFRQLDHLITLHQRKLEEMKKQKKSLMQLLLTGIVRCKW